MATVSLEQVIKLADQLSVEERQQLVEHLQSTNGSAADDASRKREALIALSGKYKSGISDLSTTAREYLRDYFRNKYDTAD